MCDYVTSALPTNCSYRYTIATLPTEEKVSNCMIQNFGGKENFANLQDLLVQSFLPKL